MAKKASSDKTYILELKNGDTRKITNHGTAVDTSSGRVVAHNNADSSTQESVVAWFDRAIATEREHPTEKA